MNIYLAAPYSCMSEMKEWEKLLVEAGHVCTAQWLQADPNTPWGGEPAASAALDLADIDRADTVISKVLPGKPVLRGSRHVEFGYALALGKKLINVGPGSENLFHELPSVQRFPTIQDAIAAL